MIIRSAIFVTSATGPGNYPPEHLPEIAFAGRSNVGKSSLINTLVQRKKLVKTSSTPGHTRTLNFFEINNAIGFVDLPGYGYARVPKEMRQKWRPMMETFLSKRRTLRGVVLICDIRRTPEQEERDLMSWLAARGIPCILAATKTDKLNKSKAEVQKVSMAKALSVNPADVTLFSAKTGQGRDQIWQAIKLLSEPALQKTDAT